MSKSSKASEKTAAEFAAELLVWLEEELTDTEFLLSLGASNRTVMLTEAETIKHLRQHIWDELRRSAHASETDCL